MLINESVARFVQDYVQDDEDAIPDQLPEELAQNSKTIDLIVFTIMFVIGAPANFRVLYNLLSNQTYKKSRHHLILLNLAVADSFVSFVMIPAEVRDKWPPRVAHISL